MDKSKVLTLMAVFAVGAFLVSQQYEIEDLPEQLEMAEEQYENNSLSDQAANQVIAKDQNNTTSKSVKVYPNRNKGNKSQRTKVGNSYVLKVRQLIPPVEVIEKQMDEDSHHMAPALGEFAVSLGQLVRQSMNSSGAAQQMLVALNDCVNAADIDTFNSIRSACLMNARDIGKRFPKLQANYEDIERLAPHQVVDIIKFIP